MKRSQLFIREVRGDPACQGGARAIIGRCARFYAREMGTLVTLQCERPPNACPFGVCDVPKRVAIPYGKCGWQVDGASRKPLDTGVVRRRKEGDVCGP